MQVIKFSVYDTRLRRITSGIISPKEYGQLKFEFDFRTINWDEHTTKTAIFVIGDKEYPIELDENNQCYVPKEVLETDLFNVYISSDGIKTNSVGNLVEKTTYSPIKNVSEALAAEIIRATEAENALSDRIDILEDTAVQTTTGTIDAGKIIERS